MFFQPIHEHTFVNPVALGRQLTADAASTPDEQPLLLRLPQMSLDGAGAVADQLGEVLGRMVPSPLLTRL